MSRRGSHRSKSPTRWFRIPGSRRVVAVLLLIMTLPSMFLNVGVGRSVLFHDHQDGRLHTHVVTDFTHARAHNTAHAHDGGSDHSLPDRHHDSDDRHGSGTFIRGAEFASGRRGDCTAEFVAAPCSPWALVPARIVLPDVLELSRPSHDAPSGTCRTPLASLRAVVLLI